MTEIDFLTKDTLVPITKIRENELNSQKHDEKRIDELIENIKRIGWTTPLQIDSDGVIIAGHKRFYAAQKMELMKVPCVVFPKGTTKEDLIAHGIFDNKSTKDASYHLHNLEILLGALEDADYDLKPLALDELKPLFVEEEDEEVKDDEAPAPPSEEDCYIKKGDVIELGRHRLICGDSTDPETVEELLQGNEVTLMVTDPPYGVEYDPSYRSDNPKKQGKVANDDKADWREAYRLSDAQVAYVWHAAKFADVVLEGLRETGFEPVAQIIWAKDRFAMSRGDYHWKHEPCWYAVRAGSTHNWQGARDQHTLWEIKAREDDGHGHGTQKPMECMARPIKNNTKKGELVYDPFLGSGTTLMACEQLGRVCRGIEIEPKYCQVIIERYRKFCNEKGNPAEVKVNGEPI